jgi:Xaa-Pro aminopeptidase
VSQWTRRTAQAFALLGRDTTPRVELLVPTGNADLAIDAVADDTALTAFGSFAFAKSDEDGSRMTELERRLYSVAQFQKDDGLSALEVLAEAIKRMGGEASTVAIENAGLADLDWPRLRSSLPRCRFVPAHPIFAYARAVKTEDEVRRLEAAARISEAAATAALSRARLGDSELSIARRLHSRLIAQDSTPFLTSITAGRRTALPNGQASSARVRTGDAVRFDGGGRHAMYVSDIARMVVVGEASEKLRRYYHAVWRGLDAAASLLRPGSRVRDIYAAAVGSVREAGIPHYTRTHCGHGIGIENYDWPLIDADSEELLEEGMVVCLETPYYELGWGGVQVEDTFLITASGARRFTVAPADIIEACSR